METENLKEEALNYNKAKPELDKLIGTWSTPIMEIKKTRAFRKITRDPAKLRAQKKLAKDETLIIIRSVDNNIRRIKPNWLAYVVSSRRIVEVMDDSSGGRSSANARRLETDFSADLRTSETIRSFSQQIDSCLLYGTGYADVVYDSSKPLNFSIDYVAADKLLFERHCEDVQDSRFVLRRFDMTFTKLENLAERLNFNKDAVRGMKERLKTGGSSEAQITTPISIYKGYVKIDGVVNVFHYSADGGATTWLKKPEPLYIGLDEETEVEGEPVQMIDELGNIVLVPGPTSIEFIPAEVLSYPVYVLEYETTEDEKLVSAVGRGHIDKPIQEAETTLISAAVNRATRSSHIFFSTKENTDKGMTTSDDILEPGKIYNQPLQAMTLPPGSGEGTSVLNVVRTISAQNAGSVSASIQDKRTSRTTAAEVTSATEQENAISSMGLINLSNHVTNVCDLGLAIAISQALQERITFVYNPETQENDTEVLRGSYSVHPAGDADAGSRKAILSQMREFWPMASQMSIAHKFFARMVELGLPSEAADFAPEIEQSQNMQALIGQLTQALQQSVDDEELAALDPKQRQALEQLLQQGAQVAQLTEGQ